MKYKYTAGVKIHGLSMHECIHKKLTFYFQNLFLCTHYEKFQSSIEFKNTIFAPFVKNHSAMYITVLYSTVLCTQ